MLIEKLPDVQALAPTDKWRLIDELCHDLAQQAEGAEPDPRIVDLLEKRYADYVADPSSARPLVEFEIESRFAHLPAERQRTVLERLADRVHSNAEPTDESWEAGLAAMAADPEIQAEIRRIDSEFRVTEMDGLGDT
jgi:hypothetical protein